MTEARARRRHVNVIRKRPVTFAMIELADPKDCNDRKRLWRRLKFKDVTPEVAHLAKVPSLNNSSALSPGKRLIEGMRWINADWYLLSGHHGRLYASDADAYTNYYDYAARLDHAGFFNNEYHHGRWSLITREPGMQEKLKAGMADPEWRKKYRKYVLHIERELYLSTTPEAPKVLADFPQTNPLLEPAMQPARAVRCRGIIISACNTLAFVSTRKFWSRYYPDAAFIGSLKTIGHGYWITNAVAGAKMTDAGFWTDPTSVLKSNSDCIELVRQMSMKYPSSRRDFGIGLMYKGNVFVPRYQRRKLRIDVCAADDPLPYSKDPWE